ncbi:glycosyl hydrolase 115 family protein [Zunongwangia sp. F363]|uniref:Glycosyl hydrolase 115 family protein n=1 Tax=Autumnicola tepida TaxID=3075595 RepID=A0ABU3C9N6_9FLAO|nr:glycosyl hydrolase 115 family protein [Zunongwangia sp. F363]MDT0642790.1 glycosyl hydrolase 115 family protein [Zunongwangia sp. F363]
MKIMKFSHFKNIKILSLLAFVMFQYSCNTRNQDLVIKGGIPIYVASDEAKPVMKAVRDLQRDLEKFFGKTSEIVNELPKDGPSLIVVTGKKYKGKYPAVEEWESHQVYADNGAIVINGADMRGTIFAIYTFSEEILGVPPFWYYSAWEAEKKDEITISNDLNINIKSPEVKYRAWFPNDTDLFAPWRKLSRENSEMWLEAALRCKMNTMEWFDDERDYADKYSVSPTTRLIKEYGLVNTSHHHSPLNASFHGWNDYWKKTKDTVPPELSLANVKQVEEFWRYNVECIVRNDINMLWVVGFRGSGDHPFWYTFKDAPESMTARGEIIDKMTKRQHDIVLEVTENPDTQFRTIFYNELSDLLAQGYIHPLNDPTLIRTYVATRRDHYPNNDIQQLDDNSDARLGYYFNYQFNSTGSHLAAGEGPWKMEKNYRYVAEKSNKPLAYSVVNAGNIREYVMELSANAAMMWDFDSYSTDSFLKDFSTKYFGEEQASEIAKLYSDYYNSYWKSKEADFENFDRQYIFLDLRYRRAIQDIAKKFNDGYKSNPLEDLSNEQVKGRTYRIEPEDNGADSQIGAIITGTKKAADEFLKVAHDADAIYKNLPNDKQPFFNDNLRAPAYFMYYLNQCLLHLSQAYQMDDSNPDQKKLVNNTIEDLENAKETLKTTEHGVFLRWYEGDRVFGFDRVFRSLNDINKN